MWCQERFRSLQLSIGSDNNLLPDSCAGNQLQNDELTTTKDFTVHTFSTEVFHMSLWIQKRDVEMHPSWSVESEGTWTEVGMGQEEELREKPRAACRHLSVSVWAMRCESCSHRPPSVRIGTTCPACPQAQTSRQRAENMLES